jgi:hypothetical protein
MSAQMNELEGRAKTVASDLDERDSIMAAVKRQMNASAISMQQSSSNAEKQSRILNEVHSTYKQAENRNLHENTAATLSERNAHSDRLLAMNYTNPQSSEYVGPVLMGASALFEFEKKHPSIVPYEPQSRMDALAHKIFSPIERVVYGFNNLLVDLFGGVKRVGAEVHEIWRVGIFRYVGNKLTDSFNNGGNKATNALEDILLGPLKEHLGNPNQTPLR